VTDISMVDVDLRTQPNRFWDRMTESSIELAGWWHNRVSPARAQAEVLRRWEEIHLPANTDIDIAVLPGEAATIEQISRQRERRELISLIRRLLADGFTWGERATPITPETERAAIALVGLLPAAMPKVSPDGEGGLLMVWEAPADNPLLIVVDGCRLHMVTAATTARASYYDDLAFDGQQLPSEVLAATALR